MRELSLHILDIAQNSISAKAECLRIVVIEDMATEDIIHFFESLTLNARINLHILIKYGSNDHHKAEAGFKSFAHALRKASLITSDKLLSTKGKLE